MFLGVLQEDRDLTERRELQLNRALDEMLDVSKAFGLGVYMERMFFI